MAAASMSGYTLMRSFPGLGVQPIRRAARLCTLIATWLAASRLERSDTSSRPASFTMRFGGGIDIYANQNVMMRAEGSYVLPFGNLDDIQYVSIGMGVHFRF